MKQANLLLGAGAVMLASWAVPAKAERTVTMLVKGIALVCDTNWPAGCYECYGPPVETRNGGWECFPALRRPGNGPRTQQREMRNGWLIKHPPKRPIIDSRKVQAEYRNARLRARGPVPGSARAVAVLQKLFPQRAKPVRRTRAH